MFSRCPPVKVEAKAERRCSAPGFDNPIQPDAQGGESSALVAIGFQFTCGQAHNKEQSNEKNYVHSRNSAHPGRAYACASETQI